jgi:hypothetical protein
LLLKPFTITILPLYTERIKVVAGVRAVMLVVLIQDLVYGLAMRVLVYINRTGRTWRKEEKGAFIAQHS